MSMRVVLISKQPVYEDRGARRVRVRRGAARDRWAIVSEEGRPVLDRTYRTRAEAVRVMGKVDRTMKRMALQIREQLARESWQREVMRLDRTATPG